jgi:cytochrome c oxidase subunit 2
LGRTATIIAVFYGVVAVLSVVVALAVWRSTRVRGRSVDTGLLARREKTWFGVAVALLAALLFATIFFTPFGKSAPRNRQVVRVTGFQFAWAIEPQAVKANVPVEFRLTSADVSHAFAVYNDRDELLFQVQVLPGKTQKALYTFKRPGIYRVLCLEFCGFGHDLMQSTIQVKPA